MAQISSRERRAREKARRKELQQIKKANRRQIGKTLWHAFLWLVVVGFVLLHVVGGWYFSDMIKERVFVPPTEPAAPNVTVTLVEGDRITLRAEDSTLASLERDLFLGLKTDSGYIQLEKNPESGIPGEVTRRFQVLTGGIPAPGALGFVDSYYYPDFWGRTQLGVRDVTYSTELGTFSAWELVGSGDIWVIHVHGKGAPLSEALRMMIPLSDAGYPQLAITYRNDVGQPEDPTGYYQYGAEEWKEVEGAIEYAVSRGARQVVLYGYSTGAALAMRASFYDNQAYVAGLVLDSPNLDISRAISFAAEKERFLGLPLLPTMTETAKMLAALRTGANYRIMNILADAGRLRVPALVFHGTEDDVIPMSASEELRDARRSLVELVKVEGAGHVECWNADPAGYAAKVIEFLAGLES